MSRAPRCTADLAKDQVGRVAGHNSDRPRSLRFSKRLSHHVQERHGHILAGDVSHEAQRALKVSTA